MKMKWGSKSSTKKKGQNSEITTCLKGWLPSDERNGADSQSANHRPKIIYWSMFQNLTS